MKLVPEVSNLLLNDLGLDVVGLLGGVGFETSYVVWILGFDVLHQ